MYLGMLTVERIIPISGFVMWIQPECGVAGTCDQYYSAVTKLVDIQSGAEWYLDEPTTATHVLDEFRVGDVRCTLTTSDINSEHVSIGLWRLAVNWDVVAIVEIPDIRCGSQIFVRCYQDGVIYATYGKYLIVLRIG